MMHQVQLPLITPGVIQFARDVGSSWLGWVPVKPKPHCREWDCHNNTLQYTAWYGGVRVLGYYLLHDVLHNRLGAILHSVVRRDNQELWDITPFPDDRSHNLFCVLKDQTANYSVKEIWSEYHDV
jgi:hypothetical protein